MRFDFEALRQYLPEKKSYSLASLLAAGSVALASLIVIYGVLLGTGEDEAEANVEAVAVNGPTFTPVAVTPPAPSPAVKPSGPDVSSAPRFEDAVSITRAVQTELKRAGCYSGPVNGVWTASTRAAMGEFTARVNAQLPVDRADPVLLALLETHNKISCTAECNAGTDGGKGCVPRGAPLPRSKSEVAAVEEAKPAEAREEAYRSASSAQTGTGSGDLGSASQDRPARSAVSAVETASVDTPATSPDGTSALPAVAPAPKITGSEPRRTARKYKRQPSLSRQVSKGFKSLQRSLNKLF